MPSLPGRVPGTSAPQLPADVTGPVAVMLAKAAERIPTAAALSGGCQYEPKWDGYRMVVVRGADRTRLWSKQGRDLTVRFPEIAAAAAAKLRPGTVLDGEVVIWCDDRLDFGLLQRRNIAAPARIGALVAAHPASYVAFDLLADGGADRRGVRLVDRRARLEHLAAGWAPPLHLTPATTDAAEAAGWFADYRPAGVEGLVVKGLSGRYRPGRREWVKVKSRETVEAIVGGVIGTLDRPQQLVVGRYRDDGRLVVVGRTSPLATGQAVEVAPLLGPPVGVHPWPERIGTGFFGGGRLSVALTRAQPALVVEVAADAALSAGVFRHPLRFVRVRTDLDPSDVDRLP